MTYLGNERKMPEDIRRNGMKKGRYDMPRKLTNVTLLHLVDAGGVEAEENEEQDGEAPHAGAAV